MNDLFTPWLLWLLAGVALALLELAVPGFILIFFGAGCLVVALCLLVLDLTLTQQLWLFLIATLVSLIGLRRFAMRIFAGEQAVNPVDQLLDEPHGTARVVQAIRPPVPGRVAWRGSFWDAQAEEDLEVDALVAVRGYAEGSRSQLQVEALPAAAVSAQDR